MRPDYITKDKFPIYTYSRCSILVDQTQSLKGCIKIIFTTASFKLLYCLLLFTPKSLWFGLCLFCNYTIVFFLFTSVMYLLSLHIYLLLCDSSRKLQYNLGIFVHDTLHTEGKHSLPRQI